MEPVTAGLKSISWHRWHGDTIPTHFVFSRGVTRSERLGCRPCVMCKLLLCHRDHVVILSDPPGTKHWTIEVAVERGRGELARSSQGQHHQPPGSRRRCDPEPDRRAGGVGNRSRASTRISGKRGRGGEYGNKCGLVHFRAERYPTSRSNGSDQKSVIRGSMHSRPPSCADADRTQSEGHPARAPTMVPEARRAVAARPGRRRMKQIPLTMATKLLASLIVAAGIGIFCANVRAAECPNLPPVR